MRMPLLVLVLAFNVGSNALSRRFEAVSTPLLVLHWLPNLVSRLYELVSSLVLALWDLGDKLQVLDRLVIIFIAVLLAFLTVARLWKVPPAATELTAPVPELPSSGIKRAADKAAGARDT